MMANVGFCLNLTTIRVTERIRRHWQWNTNKVEVNSWLIYSDSALWLEFVSHNGLDVEFYNLRLADLH